MGSLPNWHNSRQQHNSADLNNNILVLCVQCTTFWPEQLQVPIVMNSGTQHYHPNRWTICGTASFHRFQIAHAFRETGIQVFRLRWNSLAKYYTVEHSTDSPSIPAYTVQRFDEYHKTSIPPNKCYFSKQPNKVWRPIKKASTQTHLIHVHEPMIRCNPISIFAVPHMHDEFEHIRCFVRVSCVVTNYSMHAQQLVEIVRSAVGRVFDVIVVRKWLPSAWFT